MYVRMNTSVWTHMYVHMCVCACGGQRSTPRIFFNLLDLILYVTQGLTKGLTDKVDWLARRPRTSSCFCLAVLDYRQVCCHAWLSTWKSGGGGSELTTS